MSRFFSKLAHGANRFFSKVRSDAPKILGKISNGLGQAGNAISKIAANPIVQAGIDAVAPEAAPALLANSLIASNVAHQASALTNKNNYRGNVNQVSGNVLERAKNIQSTAQQAQPINFH